jgi:NADH-quinone oxidoreductase subunit G
MCARQRQAARRELGRGLRRHRREGEGDEAGAHRRDRRRSRQRRGDVRAQGAHGQTRRRNIDCRQDGTTLHPAHGRASYIFNATVAGIEQADAILIVGSNPRRESPVLNARILKRWRQGGARIALIGEQADLTYPVEYLGAGPDTLSNLGAFGDALARAARPLVIVGQGALARADGLAVLAAASKLAQRDGWNGFCVLHTAASRVGGLDIGFTPGEGGLDAAGMAQAGALDVLFNLGADEIDIAPGAFVVYQGSHGDKGAHRADVILPGAAYTEKSGTWVNTEGRVQVGQRAAFPPGDAREDWAILRALVRRARPASALRFAGRAARRAVRRASGMASIGAIPGVRPGAPDRRRARQGALRQRGSNFYFTNPIARASAVMAECSALAQSRLRQAAE